MARGAREGGSCRMSDDTPFDLLARVWSSARELALNTLGWRSSEWATTKSSGEKSGKAGAKRAGVSCAGESARSLALARKEAEKGVDGRAGKEREDEKVAK